MSRSRSYLVLALVGGGVVVAAFILETRMGSGSGHRYLPVHAVGLVGFLLIFISAMLRLDPRGRRPRAK